MRDGVFGWSVFPAGSRRERSKGFSYRLPFLSEDREGSSRFMGLSRGFAPCCPSLSLFCMGEDTGKDADGFPANKDGFCGDLDRPPISLGRSVFFPAIPGEESFSFPGIEGSSPLIPAEV